MQPDDTMIEYWPSGWRRPCRWVRRLRVLQAAVATTTAPAAAAAVVIWEEAYMCLSNLVCGRQAVGVTAAAAVGGGIVILLCLG
jgi:hypothetical protein